MNAGQGVGGAVDGVLADVAAAGRLGNPGAAGLECHPAARRSIAVTLPLRIGSVRAFRVSRERKAWRERAQRLAAVALLRNRFDDPPMGEAFDLTIVRIGGKQLDRSNLMVSMRGVLCGVCDWLGIDPSDPLLERRIRQRPGRRREGMAVEIVVEAL